MSAPTGWASKRLEQAHSLVYYQKSVQQDGPTSQALDEAMAAIEAADDKLIEFGLYD